MLQKVIDFKVVTGDSFGALENEVKSALSEEWVPSGPMVVRDAEIGQAMVKFEQA